jgi:predicted  nucleic acid-binding Zn-ribbon protein
MADVAIMEEVTKPYREALAAAEAEAERARDDFNRVCGKSAV